MLVILICIFGFPASSCIYYDISLHVMNVVFISECIMWIIYMYRTHENLMKTRLSRYYTTASKAAIRYA